MRDTIVFQGGAEIIRMLNSAFQRADGQQPMNYWPEDLRSGIEKVK